MKNTLGDLNNHLFAALERLGDEDLTGEELEDEIKRASAIFNISKSVIDNANVILNAVKFRDANLCKGDDFPEMLEG